MNFEPEASLANSYFSVSSGAELPNQEKPKILALAHSTNLAGAQLALASLVKNTAEQLDWTIVCPNDGPFVQKIDPYAEARVVSERYPWWCKGSAYTQPPTDFHIEKLNEVFDDVDYDYALTNTITIPWLAYNARLRDKPHMWYIHEYGDLDHNLSFALGYDQSISYINQVSDTVMTVSKSVGEHLLKHGASEDTLRYISQSFEVQEYLDIEPPAGENDLLILGSIKKSKGQLDALIGFDHSSIKESHSLTIAGPVTESWYAESIQDYIGTHGLANRVRFIPERVDAVEQMKQASAVLVCSRNEALGRITLEALAAGRVVVGSQGGGTETLLSDSRGILYDGSVEDLTLKLDQLKEVTGTLASPAERRQYTIDNFSPANERNDFLAAIRHAEQHHAEAYLLHQQHIMGKTGIFSAMKEGAIIA